MLLQRCLDERKRILDRLHPPDPARNHILRMPARLGQKLLARLRLRLEALDIDAVGYTGHAFRRNANPIAEIDLQIARQRDIVMHQRSHHSPQTAVAAIGASEIAHIAPVFAVDSRRNPRQPSRNMGLQCREIARVDDIRAEIPQRSPQPGIERGILAFALVERDQWDISPFDTLGEMIVILQTDHGVAIPLYRQTVDQIDQSVLQSANAQAMDHVGHERHIVPITH